MAPFRSALGIWTIFVVAACAHRWTGAEPGYSESGAGHGSAGKSATTRPLASEAAPIAPRSPQGAATVLPAPEAGSSTETTPSPFPPETHSLAVREQAHVRSEPSYESRYIGKITRGTRVAWKRVVPGDAEEDKDRARRRRRPPCPSWVEIEPMGWLCNNVLDPSSGDPSGVHQPVVPHGKLTPHDYFHVGADDTQVFETADDVRAQVVKKFLSHKVMVIGAGFLNVDGTEYLKTDHGLIESAALARYWPSNFEGADLRKDQPAFPFAWVYIVRGGRPPDVFGEPNTKSDRVRRASRREIVPVLEERDSFVRIGEGQWIERKHLRVAALLPPPEGVGENEQWIDVDLDEQVLVAYEGKRPVFATLVSTGKKNHPTPIGTYRVRAKAATTTMAGDPSIPDRYEVSAVPWAVRFRSGLFIHGVYWHDGFGGVVSHGCVNVSPKDAAFIYEWITPPVPDGWSEIEVPPGKGALVRIRDHANPSPPAFDYTAEDEKQ